MNGWWCVLDQSSLSLKLKQFSFHLRILQNPIDFALQFFFSFGLPNKFKITKKICFLNLYTFVGWKFEKTKSAVEVSTYY